MNRNINTKIIGKSFLEFDILSSTNNYALNLFKEKKVDEGMVIFTHHQTEGRGQMGTKWESKKEQNILMSVILLPKNVPPNQQFILNKIIALAVRDFINEVLPGDKVLIKWPNDIYVKHKKVAGILIQNVLMGHHISASIVGIGINVNQQNFDKHIPNPISIFQITNTVFEIKKLLPKLFITIENWYLKLQSNQISKIDKAYESYLYLKGEKAFFEKLGNEVIEGIIQGVSDYGKLIIQSKEEIKEFDLKEIKFIK